MTDSRSTEEEAELRQRALVHLQEAQKILDRLNLMVAAARLDYVISEVKAADEA